MADESKKASAEDPETVAAEDDDYYFEPSGDGMSTLTAKVAIDKNLRKKLLEDYELIDLENRGRYFAARVYTKDGQWLNELLIDKQTGHIQVVSQKKVRRKKGS